MRTAWRRRQSRTHVKLAHATGLAERYFTKPPTVNIRAVCDDDLHTSGGSPASAARARPWETIVELMVDDPVHGRVLLLAPAVEWLTRSGAGGRPTSTSCCESAQFSHTSLIQFCRNWCALSDRRSYRSVHRISERTAGNTTKHDSSTTASTCCSAPPPPTHRTAAGDRNLHPSRAAQLRTTGFTPRGHRAPMPSCPLRSACRAKPKLGATERHGHILTATIRHR